MSPPPPRTLCKSDFNLPALPVLYFLSFSLLDGLMKVASFAVLWNLATIRICFFRFPMFFASLYGRYSHKTDLGLCDCYINHEIMNRKSIAIRKPIYQKNDNELTPTGKKHFRKINVFICSYMVCMRCLMLFVDFHPPSIDGQRSFDRFASRSCGERGERGEGRGHVTNNDLPRTYQQKKKNRF